MRTSYTTLGQILCLGLLSCTPEIQQFDTQVFLDQRIQFLEEGRTTRQQVLLELGQPHGRYENDRVLVYVLDIPADTSGPKVKQYHLVTVFDGGGVLREHSVVVSR